MPRTSSVAARPDMRTEMAGWAGATGVGGGGARGGQEHGGPGARTAARQSLRRARLHPPPTRLDAAAPGALPGSRRRGARGRHLGRRRQLLSGAGRSEEHTSELQSLMRISYAVFCLKKKTTNNKE